MIRLTHNRLALLASTVSCLVVGLFIVLIFGAVFGEEFSPQLFSHRSYYYWRIPLIRVQVWPVGRSQSSRSATADYLVKQKYVRVAANPRWDLVHSSADPSLRWSGDAMILTTYLAARSAQTDEPFWLEWTKNHKQLARILWPEVAKLARTNQYELLPLVFDAAASTTTPKQLSRELSQRLAREYEALAKVAVQQKHDKQATEYQAVARSYRAEPAKNTP